MGLVDYSDSDHSDHEPAAAPTSKPTNPSKKPAFQKVVDRSDARKIRVDLPKVAPDEAAGDDADADGGARPSKRARVGGGAFSGFNSFLPAPKRTGLATGLGARKGGLGSGVNLKTGAAPGFSREPEPRPVVEHPEDSTEAGFAASDAPAADAEGQTSGLPTKGTTFSSEAQLPENKKVGKSTMFKPLSVAKKPRRKKPAPPSHIAEKAEATTGSATTTKPSSRPSLFSLGDEKAAPLSSVTGNGEYEPIIYEPTKQGLNQDSSPPVDDSSYSDAQYNEVEPVMANSVSTEQIGPQSLDSIAADLGLSESAKRQLFGRQRGQGVVGGSQVQSAVNIINFNTDKEYAANETLRAAGETVQHNPVRAIAPGKHSLKQLVSAASTQKEALEEHFASGKRNKKEAGSKYGW